MYAMLAYAVYVRDLAGLQLRFLRCGNARPDRHAFIRNFRRANHRYDHEPVAGGEKYRDRIGASAERKY